MNSQNDQEKLGIDDQGLGEVFVPSQVVKNFNQMVAEPHPLPSDRSVKPPSENNGQNQAPLLTDKQQAQPLIKKPDQVVDESKKQPKPMQGSAHHSQDDVSIKSSGGGTKSPHHQQAQQKRIKRMNSRVKSRHSQQKQQSDLSKRILKITESTVFSIIMAIVTIYALFGDDVRILSVDKQGDDVFFVLTVICMVAFIVEITLTSIAKPEYILNFYFILDVISTLTMILDLGWITDTWYSGDLTSASQIKSIGTASRAARKAARVIRVIRLVRLVKLYKHARQQMEREQQRKLLQDLLRQAQQSKSQDQQQQQQQQQEQNLTIQQIIPQNDESRNNSQNEIEAAKTPDRNSNSQNKSSQVSSQAENQIKESIVGAQLSDLVMRRVITIILAILISIPVLSLDTYQETISSYDSGIYRIYQFKDNSEVMKSLLYQYAQFHIGEIYPIYSVNVNLKGGSNTNLDEWNYDTNPEIFEVPTYENNDQYRFSDLQYYVKSDGSDLQIYASADLVAYNQTNAILSIFQTVFVCIVLAVSALMFNKDVSDLVIDPIEGMMQKIEMIAANPLEAVNIEEQEDLIMEELEKSQDVEKLKQKEIEKHMETYVLQRLIMKVGALLAVGFGEAGSEIIAENIRKGGSVDPMIPGKKILAIFGFCDIRNFTDATEVLQQGVMLFVNEIAEIVHSTVDSMSGSANKNIGDAFLLVWKYSPNDYHPDPDNPKNLKLKTDRYIKQKGDMAVMGFLKIITAISISKKLEKYKKHEGLNARMKDYSVKMGFGLHMGWGIEGAIGSGFKIDASYLSPNVNMASRLEAATKQFGSLILVSGILKQYLTEECQKQMRMIDIVTVKGSIMPLELHTVDMSIKNLQSKIKTLRDKFDVSSMTQKESKKFRVVNRFKRDQQMKQVMNNQINITDLFEKDDELSAAREPYTQQFYEIWKQGFDQYIKGNWGEAQSIFQKTLTMIPEHKDGPSNTLLEVIHSCGGKAPKDWKGYRELTEK
ncbi:unnamed protein product [Paramecium pentaurelia]|uniref:Guanylate cyclase domain-containing protein n=1 Tax=Paramecium pentaurelia TaxID=43138 RepID=A0A8S1WSH7_9CILI|nr:unnamed protein product [Paramecium pentaurelia]